MSLPGPKAAFPHDGAPGTARWLNMVTTMVLGAAALIVGVVAVPSVLHAVTGSAARAGDFAPPVRATNPPIVSGEHPGPRVFEVDPDDEPPAPPGAGFPSLHRTIPAAARPVFQAIARGRTATIRWTRPRGSPRRLRSTISASRGASRRGPSRSAIAARTR